MPWPGTHLLELRDWGWEGCGFVEIRGAGAVLKTAFEFDRKGPTHTISVELGKQVIME
jgi:hypothetical protein